MILKLQVESDRFSGSDDNADVGDGDGDYGDNEDNDVPTDDDEEHLADLMAAATTIKYVQLILLIPHLQTH